MNKQLFRAKSIQKVSSPEQLDTYIRVSNPGVWILLAAIIVLLIGVCVWGVLGRLDTTLTTVAQVEDGQITVYVKEEHIDSIAPGMTVKIGDEEFTFTTVSPQPVAVDSGFTEYACHVGELQQGQWVYPVSVSGTAADGVYSARIVIESVSPISFVIN